MEHREQTVEELKARLRLCAQKSNRRKSALKSLMKSHELLELRHRDLSDRHSSLYRVYSEHKCPPRAATPPARRWWHIWP